MLEMSGMVEGADLDEELGNSSPCHELKKVPEIKGQAD